jgi:hypothetical protein
VAFRRLKFFDPYINSVDPRVDGEWGLNSTNSIIAITPYPTFKDMIKNDPAGISNTKMLGSVSNITRNEAVQFSTFYDIGNKLPIDVPGKMIGYLTLESGIFESINLLGSMYETLLDSFEKKYGVKFKDLRKRILYTPALNKTYSESDNMFQPNPDGSARAVTASPSNPNDLTGDNNVENDTTNEGAILMSLSDIRTRIKFGLVIVFFQNEDRVKTEFDSVAVTSTVDNTSALENRRDILGTGAGNTNKLLTFKILSGVFLENCYVTSYNSNIVANQGISSPMESVSIKYTNARNIKNNLIQGDPNTPPITPPSSTSGPATPPITP